jgi:hypothetical protein
MSTPPAISTAELFDFLDRLHGELTGYICCFSGERINRARDITKGSAREQFFAFPAAVASAAGWLSRESAAGREVYVGAHLFTRQKRSKETAANVASLYVDGDRTPIPTGPLRPTLVVASSPGRWQGYWRLPEPIAAAQAEDLNHRLAAAIGADASGWDLTQLLRVPGAANRKYAGNPIVDIAEYDPSRLFDPEELNRTLPPSPPRISIVTSTEACGDMPPVRLDDAALSIWRGERPAFKTDSPGEIDRSDSLWKIAAVLWEANASPIAIADALAERDQSLGWNRYIDRPEQYTITAAKIAAKGAPLRLSPRPAPPPDIMSTTLATAGSNDPPRSDNDPCAGVRDDVAHLRAENARLTRERDESIAEQDDLRMQLASTRRRAERAEELLSIYRNPKLGAQRGAAAGLVDIFRTEAPAPVEKRPTGLTNKEACYRVPLAKLAEITNLSPDALSRQTDVLASYTTPDGAPILHREVVTIPSHIDRDTGEITSAHKELWIGPGTDPTAFGALLATLNPSQRKAHGGNRDACADHPNAGTIRRSRRIEETTVECSECHRTLHTESRNLPGERVTTTPPSPMPHVAGLPVETTSHEDTTSIPQHAPTTYRDCGSDQYRNLPDSRLTPESAARIAAARADIAARQAAAPLDTTPEEPAYLAGASLFDIPAEAAGYDRHTR